MVVAKFASHSDRDNAIAILRQNNDNQKWVKPDRPLNERVLRSLVFGLKQLFIDWKYDVAGLWVDPNDGAFSIGKNIRFHYDRRNNLKLEYGHEWEAYLTDVGWPEWYNLVVDMNAKLAVSNMPTKGLGKNNK